MSTESAAIRRIDRPRHPFEGATGQLTRIGETPLVRLGAIVEGRIPSRVEIHAKIESCNPGGSVKDRAARARILEARRTGALRAGMTLLDASSGNTGIAYAMIGAALGHPLTLCLPANASAERRAILRAYGAEVISTDPLEGSDGAIVRARELADQQPDRFFYVDQYGNSANWRAHYGSTGPEIWRQTGGQVRWFVATLGTSGTFVGTARYLKEQDPRIRCASLQPDSPFHGLEGLKHMETSIVPPIYDPSVADEQVEVPTEESLELTRRLAREEGLLVGPSGGAALWGAIEAAGRLDEGVVVTVFPDGGERYLSEPHLWGTP